MESGKTQGMGGDDESHDVARVPWHRDQEDGGQELLRKPET